MRCLHFKEENKQLGRPLGWNEKLFGPCETLPVFGTGNEFLSLWGLSWKERWQLLFGGKIMLRVAANFHPPVAMEVNIILTEESSHE